MYFFSKKFRIEVTRSGIRRVIVEYVLETDYFWAGYAPVPNGRYRIHVPAQAGFRHGWRRCAWILSRARVLFKFILDE